ncbi:MAG: CvpA family protein [Chthoniobacter sp.]|uniref:CvpA family protein n=1 Tax=Chthoniobacter sp. TaxID=2510640 RepID=UPI0032A72868
MNRLDSYQAGFLVGAVLFIAFTAWHGWRLGIVRQIMSILALAAAYIIGYFGGGNLGRLLHHFFDLPERALAVLGAVGLGFVVYCCITLLGVIAFTKTAQQKAGLTRLGYGISGSACGALYGLFLVWIMVLAIRLLGSVAETQLTMPEHPRLIAGKPSPSPSPSPTPPSAMIRTLAHMKESLEQGATGAVVQQVDPIPGTLYGILRKLGVMVSDDKSVDRFLSYPGVKPLLAHPKIAALQNDAQISRDIVNQNYFALIRNPHIITAANDAEIAELMRKFEFEKALDYAIRRPEQDTAENRRGRGQ